MKTVIVTPDLVGPIQNGGIGTFATNLALLLRQNGHEVSILFTSPEDFPRRQWIKFYKEHDINVINVKERTSHNNADGDWWFIRRSESVSKHLPPDTDIVYLQDWHGNGFHSLRSRRYRSKKYPVFVSVLHSNSDWVREGSQEFSEYLLHDMSLSFAERYTTQHSDFVVAPSQYMLDWVRQHHWQLPPDNRIRVLGLPLCNNPIETPSQQAESTFKHIAYFGRLETRKGFELFVDGLLYLKQNLHYQSLKTIESIVLLGKQGITRYGTVAEAVNELEQALEIPVTVLDTYDTFQAQTYLAANAKDMLVVAPSLVDNMPYAIIEASLIDGLNLLTTDVGGIPEILGKEGRNQLFTPHVPTFATKLDEWLTKGPQHKEKLGCYDLKKHNDAWLNFHAALSEFVHSIQTTEQNPAKVSSHNSDKEISICIPYFNHGKYFPQLLKALEIQTVKNFDVIVVNDGSTDTISTQIFSEMTEKYREYGWKFISNAENLGVSETRNIAASKSNTDYLIFVDADNVPAPNMVEHFWEAIKNSDDDCLTCYLHGFEGDSLPYQLPKDADGIHTLKQVKSPLYLYMPLGNCPELGMFANIFGDANLIIKRQVFEEISGFTTQKKHHRYLGYEDYELLARLSLMGYKLDVIPEFLFFYRHLPDSLMRRTSCFQNLMRVQDTYGNHLSQIGLSHLIPKIHDLHLKSQDTNHSMNYTNPEFIATRIPWYSIRDAIWLKFKYKIQKIRRKINRM